MTRSGVGRPAAGPASGATGLGADQQPRVVAADRLGADEDRVAPGALRVDALEVGGRGEHQPLRPGVVEVAVERDAAAEQRVGPVRHRRSLAPWPRWGRRRRADRGIPATTRTTAPGRAAKRTRAPYAAAAVTPGGRSQPGGREGPGRDALAGAPARDVGRDRRAREDDQGEGDQGAEADVDAGRPRGHDDDRGVTRDDDRGGQEDAWEGPTREQAYPQVGGTRRVAPGSGDRGRTSRQRRRPARRGPPAPRGRPRPTPPPPGTPMARRGGRRR